MDDPVYVVPSQPERLAAPSARNRKPNANVQRRALGCGEKCGRRILIQNSNALACDTRVDSFNRVPQHEPTFDSVRKCLVEHAVMVTYRLCRQPAFPAIAATESKI